MHANQEKWGIDLGGTKIEGVILSSSTGEVLFRQRIATEAAQGYAHLLGQIEKLVHRMDNASTQRPRHIGIGTPGSIHPATGLLKNSNTTVLNGQPLGNDLEKRLQLPVRIANDANCFALAESRMGIIAEAVPQAKVVFGVIIGTGVGGGVVVNGQVLAGRQGIAGEWGHNFLDESGGFCYCGRSGCVEKVLSGPALEAYYHSLGKDHAHLKTIVERAALEEAAALKTMERLFFFFGKAIAQVINILDPDAIVIGGGVGNIDTLYTEGVRAAGPFVFNTTMETPIFKPKLGDSAGVFGAALL